MLILSPTYCPVWFKTRCADRGCPAAALRVWPWENKQKTPIELCGDSLGKYEQILSETNVLQIS